MKILLKNLYCFLIVTLFVACSNSDEADDANPIIACDQKPQNIEVFKCELFEESYVFAIKNGGLGAFLLNKRGDKVHEWEFDTNLGNDLELLPDGKLIGMFKVQDPSFSFGGFGGIVKILNKDGSTDWEYKYASDNYIAHHDVELLPNGNVLFLAWERITASEAQSVGVDTEFDIFPEVLIEVNPDTNQIVWQWRSFDHIIQDKFSELSSFGNISENPQLIDINYALRENGDIMHANGIDYDENKDIVYISVNFYSEIWVVDHSTSTQQASTNEGGNFNKGGNLLYRFGNPEVYDNPEGERLFFNNHFPNLLEGGEPGEGNVLVYVNAGKDGAEQSFIYELEIPSSFNLQPNANNEPNVVWSFTDSELYYQRISGAVRLKNGNTLICEGDYGFWEVTPSGEVAWKYNGANDNTDFWRCYAYGITSPHVQSIGL